MCSTHSAPLAPKVRGGLRCTPLPHACSRYRGDLGLAPPALGLPAASAPPPPPLTCRRPGSPPPPPPYNLPHCAASPALEALFSCSHAAEPAGSAFSACSSATCEQRGAGSGGAAPPPLPWPTRHRSLHCTASTRQQSAAQPQGGWSAVGLISAGLKRMFPLGPGSLVPPRSPCASPLLTNHSLAAPLAAPGPQPRSSRQMAAVRTARMHGGLQQRPPCPGWRSSSAGGTPFL